MAFPIFVLAAAAAALAAAQHPAIDPAQAQAAGYAQAQQALAAQSGQASVIAPAAPQAPEAPGAWPAAEAVSGEALALTCSGAGTADKQRGSVAFGRRGWAGVVSYHDRQFADQIDVRLFSGDDRIRIPRTMLPGLHGGQDGWFQLKD